MADGYELIVVGGSITGLSAARAAVDELSILVLDSKPRIGEPFRCSGFINVESFDQFSLDKDAIQNRLSNLRFICGDRSILMHAKEAKGYVTERPEIEKNIKADLQEKGAEIATGKRVTRVKGNSVFIGNKSYSANYVIGADGANSVVRKSLGIADPSIINAVQYELKGDFDSDTALIYLGKEFLPYHLWVIPVSDKLARIGMGTYGGVKEGVRRLLGLVKKYEISSAENLEGSRFMTNALCASQIKEFGSGNTLLAGTAGSFIKPLSLGGISLGMQTGKMAAETCAKGGNTEDYTQKLKELGIVSRLKNEFKKFDVWSDLKDDAIRSKFGGMIERYGKEISFGALSSEKNTTGITSFFNALIGIK